MEEIVIQVGIIDAWKLNNAKLATTERNEYSWLW